MVMENKMKDLIQEGRKIQETFKKNVITEGKWKLVDTDDNPFGMGEIYIFNYDRSFFDSAGNVLKKLSGKLPRIKEITAKLNYENGYYEDGSLEIEIVLTSSIRIKDDDYEVGYREEVDTIKVNTESPFDSFRITLWVQNKVNQDDYDGAEMEKFIAQLINELKPELKKYM
jgi:hypothetical protein